MDYPILHDPGSIELLLSSVLKSSAPKVVDHDYLIDLGFKREVDEGLLKLLRFLGFIDDNGQPSALWDKSTDPKVAPKLLGTAVMAAYGSLFSEFPEAQDEEGANLMEFFRRNTGASDPNAAYMILTFKVLCDLAELPGGKPAAVNVKSSVKATAPKKTETQKDKKPIVSSPEHPEGPLIRICLNIDLDKNSDPDLRDLAMRVLKKQLEL